LKLVSESTDEQWQLKIGDAVVYRIFTSQKLASVQIGVNDPRLFGALQLDEDDTSHHPGRQVLGGEKATVRS